MPGCELCQKYPATYVLIYLPIKTISNKSVRDIMTKQLHCRNKVINDNLFLRRKICIRCYIINQQDRDIINDVLK